MKNKIHLSSLLPVFSAATSSFFRVRHFSNSLLFILSMATLGLYHSPFARGETWNLSAGGSWNSALNWSPMSVPNAIGTNATFNNAASASNVAQTANSTVTLDGSKTVGSISFNNDAVNVFTYTISTGTGGPLIFDEIGAGPATITVNSITGGTGNNTISVATTLTDSLVAIVNNVTATSGSGALNLTTAMSGPGGFTKQGDGLATFGTGAKTYNGATVLSGGRTRISSAAQPSATSSFTIKAGAQLTLISASTYTFGSGPLNLNGTGATNGLFAVFPGTIRNDSGLVVTNNNPVTLESDTLIHVQASAGTGITPTPTGSLTFLQSINGPGRLTLTAPTSNVDQGSLVLNGNNGYQGGTVVNGGIILVSGASATLGTGNVTVDNSASPSSIAKLSIQAGVTNAIADTATLILAGGGAVGIADQGYVELGAGVNETVGGLKLGGVTQEPGTYGSTLSSATFQTNEFFAGTGIVTVLASTTLPSLTITLAAPNVILSWPTNATGFMLQEIATLSATNVWSGVTTPVVISGTNNTITTTASTGNRFFRLKK